jgi:hypothetical protein
VTGPVLEPPDSRVPGLERTRHPARLDRLTVAVAAAAAVSAVAGLGIDGVYASGRHGTGVAATTQMLRGYDLVTLGVVVPALLWASTGVRRTRTSGRLVRAASLAYLGYTYAYYVFGNGFTDLLLLHVAVLTGAVVALIRALPGLNSATTPDGSPLGRRGAAVTLGVLAAALGGMWVSVCVAYAATGALPEGSLLVETDQVVQLGIVLDLAVLVPLYGVAATLLWRGRRWGVALGGIALVAGVFHQLSYLAALAFQDATGVPGAVGFDPLEPVILSLYLVGTVLLFGAVHRASTAHAVEECGAVTTTRSDAAVPARTKSRRARTE